MDERTTSFIAITLAILTSGMLSAAPIPSASSLGMLHSYSVPNAIIDHLSQANITYGTGNYAALYNNGVLSFVINESSGTFVTGTNNIYNVISAYTVNQSYSQSNFSALATQMQKYQKSSAAPLADCLQETGLNTGATCTLGNVCESCRNVPVCSKVLNAVGGPATPFGYGVMQFEGNYTSLQNAYSSFFAAVNSINSSNVGSSMSQISASVQSISQISSTMGENPIFPPTQSASFQSCTGAGSASTSNVPLSGGVPWYCNALGFCQTLTYNTTIINNINSEISSLNALPFSRHQIEAIAASANSTENTYITPIIAKEKGTVLAGILNSTLSGYSSIVNGSKALLGHINNATLAQELARLESNYTKLTGNYASINLTAYNSLLAGQFGNVSSLYSGLNTSYSSLLSEAQSNTGSILGLELKSNSESPSLASLAFTQLQINKELSGSVSNLTQLKHRLDAVKLAINGMGVTENPVSAISRYLGSAIAVAVAGAFHLPYQSNVAAAPIFASMPSIVLFVLSLLFVIGSYSSARRHSKQSSLLAGKAKKEKGRGKLWLAMAVFLIYMVGSLWLSYGNNVSAPASAVSSAVASAHTVAIVLNGTQTSGMLQCALTLDSRLSSMNKTVVRADLIGDKCTSGSTMETTDACLNGYALHGVPIVMLTNSSASGISLYSFFGTMVSSSGNSTALARCLSNTVIG